MTMNSILYDFSIGVLIHRNSRPLEERHGLGLETDRERVRVINSLYRHI